MIGAARMYEVTGDARYWWIAEYFLEEVLTARSYAIGNTSLDEHWTTPADQLKGSRWVDKRRVLRGVQPDEVGAAGVWLHRRCALDGRTRSARCSTAGWEHRMRRDWSSISSAGRWDTGGGASLGEDCLCCKWGLV